MLKRVRSLRHYTDAQIADFCRRGLVTAQDGWLLPTVSGGIGTPTLNHIDGFEHQTASSAGIAGSGISINALYGTVTGTVTFPATPLAGRGGFSMRSNVSAATGALSVNPVASQATWVISLYVRCDSSTGTPLLIRCDGAAGNQVNLKRSSGNFEMSWAGTNAQTGPAWTTGVEYQLDIRISWGTARTIEWYVNGVSQTTVASDGGAATTGSQMRLGSFVSQTADIYFDHVVVSSTSGDYPIGPAYVIGYAPNADGSHNVGTDTWHKVTSNGGTSTTMTNSTTDSYTTIDEWPTTADGNASDDWVDKTAGTSSTNYVEWAFPDSAEATDPWGVAPIVAARNDSGTQSADLELRLTESGTEHATKLHDSSIGAATVVYGRGVFTTKPSGGAWTRAAWNNTTVRFYSGDIAPVPRLKSLMFEIAYPPPVPWRPNVALQAVNRAAVR